MRALVLIVVGLVIGSMTSMSVLNALQTANAKPRAVMTLLGHHLQSARKAVTGSKCTDSSPHLLAIALLAGDINVLFPSMGDHDAEFKRYASKLHSVANEAAVLPAEATCSEFTEALGRVGDACKACHREFKP